MKIQYVSKYLQYAEEGLLVKFECPKDQVSLFCNQDLNDEIYLYCLNCEYKRILGLEIYDRMVKAVNRIEQ